MIELSGDGTYWNINTAGIFKTSYGKKNKEVYNRHTTAKQSAETVETSQDATQSDTQTPSSMNVPTSSTRKDSDNSSNSQENSAILTFEDGTAVPMREDGNPDFSQMTPEQTAELYDTQFGEDARQLVDDAVTTAKKALDKAERMKVKGRNFVEQLNSKRAKDKAVAEAQSAYDLAQAVKGAYENRVQGKAGDVSFSVKDNKVVSDEERADMINQNTVDDNVADIIMGKGVRKTLQKIADMMGAKLVFLQTADVNGWFDHENNTIYVALDAGKALSSVFGHEMTHEIKAHNVDAYQSLKEVCKNLLHDANGNFDNLVMMKRVSYAKQGVVLSVEDAEEEAVADIIGDMINDLGLAKGIAFRLSHPVLAHIQNVLTRILGKLGLTSPLYEKFRDVRDTIAQAYVDTMPKEEVEAEEKAQNNGNSFSLRLQSAIDETEKEPSDAQKESGNYKKGHVKFGGYDFTIENPKGSYRSGRDADGKEWKRKMNDTYGYIRGTYGKDGDHLDMFINDKADLDKWNGNVYVVDQVNKDGSFDEHKVMYGFDSEEDAKKAYLSNYEKGWLGLGNITGVSKETFDKWLDSSSRKTKPFAEYSGIKSEQAQSEETDSQGNPLNEDGTLKLENVKSVDDLTDEDFLHPSRNVELPKLSKKVADAIGIDGKSIIIKKNIFERNNMRHKDVTPEQSRMIFNSALYNPDLYGQNQKAKRPYNWVLINTKDEEGKNRTVLLEVNPNKDNVEIVHWHFVDEKGLEKIKKQVDREDGQLLILPSNMEEVGALSDPTVNLSAANISNSSETSKEKGEKFSLREDKTLFGMHNISLDKLRKAIKQGGFAAPSMGVIDSKNGIYSGYGEITLIPKAEKIAKRTGKNIGTYAADAWTPIYPSVEKKFGGKGGDVAYNDIESVPKEMQRLTRNAIDGFMDGRDADGLAYLYLHEKGKAPGLAHVKGKYPKELHDEVRNILGKSDGLYDTDDEQKSKLLDLFIREVYDGNRDEFDNDTRMILEKTEAFIKKRPNSILAKDKQMDVDWIKEHGYDYGTLARFVDGIQRDAKTAGKVDDNATMSAAQKYVKDNGLKEDFESWKEKLNDRYNVEEVIFAGYKSDGTRKYLPNTLENAVKVMKADGRNASVGSASFSHFVASILKPMGTLDQIRKKKGNLTGNYDDVEKFQEKWQPVYEELADKMQPDASPFESYGMDRLEETASQKNPKKYAKEEYGVDLTDEDIKKMDELVDAIKNDKPSVYFETKFMRPYGLDEFDKAIVPKDTPQDVVDALKKAGIDVRTYDGKEDREKVTMEAVNDSDDIRFSLREVNDRFNEQLSEFTIEDADKFIFNLGRPSAKLKAAGVTDRPIRLNGSKLAKKIKKHGFEPNELKNLPMAMEDPIAVFDNLGREGNRSVLTELKTANGNFLVSIDLGKGSDADFDVVSSVFGKRGNSILTWINKGFLKYVDKEKALNYLHLSAPIAEASDNSELSTAAKIVKDFENPNISEGKKFSIRTYHGSGADFDHFDKEGDARIVDHTKFSLRGNKGYVGNSKSVRAVDAENRGLRPKSRIDADFVDEVRAIVKERTGSDSKITLKDVREIADKVKADEWHHTGVTFNRTDYYSPESIADYITSEDDDRTESLRSKYDDISDQMSQISNELMPAIRKKAFDGKGNFVASNGLEVEANVNDVIRGEAYHPRVESTQEFNKYGVGEYVYYSDLPSLPQNLKDEYQTAVSEYNNHVKQVRKSMSDEFSTYDALGEERNRIQGEMNSIGMPKFSLREGQTSLPERVSQYDNENGTEVERFFAFLDRGRSLEKGEKPIFHVGNSGDVLQQYGIKGNIYVSTRTVSPYRHTKNADHGLTSEEWMNALESMNEPLAITKYGEDGNGFRIYTHAVKNGKSVCLGVDVKTLDNGVEITDVTDIKTAFGRDIEKAIRNEEILYPEGEDKIEKIRRNFAQSSPTHNSQVYEQSSVSGANIDNTSETSKENGEKNTSEPKFSLRQSYDDRLSDWKKRNGLAPDEKPMDKPVRGQNESIGDFMVRMADYAKNAALWKTAPRPSGYMEALEQWKKDNGIPADEYRPAVPRKADYATDDEYQKARDQYKQEMDKWKGAPKASDYDLSVDLDGMAGKLTAITSAMLNQRSFDRQTIDGIVEMVKTMLALGWGDSPMRDLRESRIITPNFERTKRRRAGLSTGHAF